MTTAELITIIKPLLERLRKYMKNKEVFDIVHQIEAHQKELESKVMEYESEIARLKTAHTQEIDRLTREYSATITKFKERDEKELWHGSNRSDDETRILIVIAQQSALDEEQIAAATGLGVEAAKYHLKNLFGAKLLDWGTGEFEETIWQLSHNGRGYLIQRGNLHSSLS